MKPTFLKKDYKHLIRKKCVVCGKRIGDKWERYNKHGNFCQKCVSRANHLMRVKSSIGYIEREMVKAKIKKRKEIHFMRRNKMVILTIKETKYILEGFKKDLKELISTCPQYYKGEIYV